MRGQLQLVFFVSSLGVRRASPLRRPIEASSRAPAAATHARVNTARARDMPATLALHLCPSAPPLVIPQYWCFSVSDAGNVREVPVDQTAMPQIALNG